MVPFLCSGEEARTPGNTIHHAWRWFFPPSPLIEACLVPLALQLTWARDLVPQVGPPHSNEGAIDSVTLCVQQVVLAAAAPGLKPLLLVILPPLSGGVPEIKSHE